MLELINVEAELEKIQNKRTKHLVLFTILSIAIIVIDSILMIKSNSNYLLNLIFTVLLSIIYLMYLVFYFTTIRPHLVTKLSFFRNILASELTFNKCKILGYEKEKVEFKEMEFYAANVKMIGNMKDEEKTLYFFDKIEIKKNKAVILKTFGKIVLEIEE